MPAQLSPGLEKEVRRLIGRGHGKRVVARMVGCSKHAVLNVFSMHDPEAVATLLRDAGLDDVSSTVSTVALHLPSPAEFLWQYINLTPMGPFVAQTPESAQSAMEQQVVDGWQPHVVNGATLVNQPMVIASGRK